MRVKEQTKIYHYIHLKKGREEAKVRFMKFVFILFKLNTAFPLETQYYILPSVNFVKKKKKKTNSPLQKTEKNKIKMYLLHYVASNQDDYIM